MNKRDNRFDLGIQNAEETEAPNYLGKCCPIKLSVMTEMFYISPVL